MRWCFVFLLCLSACVLPATTRAPAAPRVTISPSFRGGAAYERVAIYIENNSNRQLNPGSVRTVEDEFVRALVEKGYIIASRTDNSRIQQELRFQASSATEPEKLAQLGRILNVSAVMLVSINNLDTQNYTPAITSNNRQYFRTSVSMSGRLLSAAGAEILWLSSYEGQYQVANYNAGAEALAPVAQIVASGLPRRTLSGGQPF